MRLLQASMLWVSFLLNISNAANVDRQTATTLTHPNHIFNAIHSSMRQWGSSLHHNGMSIFLATVPQGTQLYHGTCASEPVNGTEWVAFEPEHAGQFAHCRRRLPPKDPPARGRAEPEAPQLEGSWRGSRESPWSVASEPVKDESRSCAEHYSLHPRFQAGRRLRTADRSRQIPLEQEQPDLEPTEGHLHTYRTKHELRLLYLDGQSAAKSPIGTLDTQDVVLLHNRSLWLTEHSDEPDSSAHLPNSGRRGGLMDEHARARALCDLARDEWNGRINGFIRMEVGFEIIICSFRDDLDVDRITKVSPTFEPLGSLANFKAIASRFDDIGGERVKVRTDSFVTLFHDAAAVYFDERNLPRARNDSAAITSVQRAVADLVLASEDISRPSVNWQALTDMVVARYSDRIASLASGDAPDLAAFRAEIERAMRPFIDFAARNASAEIHRCAVQHFQRPPDNASVASTAIQNVTTTLCAALTDAGAAESLQGAVAIVRRLKAWLAWTTWKRCRGCAYNQVCFLPVWPLGGQADFEHPRCISNMSETSWGYWNVHDPP